MTITIDGSTGIASVDGSAGSPSVRGSDANSGIVYSADNVAFSTAGTSRANIDSSGDLNVEAGNLNVSKPAIPTVLVQNSTDTSYSTVKLQQSSGSGGYFAITKLGTNSSATGGANAAQLWQSADAAMVFGTNSTERMRIASGGDVLIGATSATAGLGVLQVQEGGTGTGINGRCTSGSYNSTVIHAQCDRNTSNSSYYFFAGVVTGVQTRFIAADSGNCYNTNGTYGQISDSRLKENIEDASSQWNDIKALKFRKFNFTEASGSPTHKQLGLVAQEAETVCPNLIEDQNIEIKGVKGDYKTIKSSVLYMKGMKALQEAMAKIETLEAKVAALEAA